jgi:SAM-dependent methyltransferase
MLATRFDLAKLAVLVAAAGALCRPGPISSEEVGAAPAEELCRAVGELEPRVSAGELADIASRLASTGSLSRWSAAPGDTLRLRVHTSGPGAYELSIRTLTGPAVPELSARIWEVPLTHASESSSEPQGAPPEGPRQTRFNAIAMGPGYHLLELQAATAGEVLLDCVSLRRTGDTTEGLGRPTGSAEEQAFLGIEIGRPQEGGVTIGRVLPSTAADAAGVEANDILLAVGDLATNTRERTLDAIESHRPGDRVEVVLLRDGEQIVRQVELGRRPQEERGQRAAHVVEVLAVKKGQVIADIGCGSGWLSAAIAERVGESGTVYAVEIRERLVRRLHRWSPANVVPVLSAPDDVSLPRDSLDTAMLHDVASHVGRSGRPSFYESVKVALKPGGKLVVFGPHGEAAAMLSELRIYGFIPENDKALAALPEEELDHRLRDGIVFHQR